MADTHGFRVVLQASDAVLRKALRGAWKSAECPVEPGTDGRIPEFLDVPAPIQVGSYEIVDGQVQIPQDELDATLLPNINGAELKLGLHVQLEVGDPPVPSARLLDMTADVRAAVPIGTLPDSLDVGLLLAGLPRNNVGCTLTNGHPLDAKLVALLNDFLHLVYENGGATPPVDPFLPHVITETNVSFFVVTLDIHTELFDDETDPAHQIVVTRPTPTTILISIPIYVRMFDIQSSLVTLLDPMGIETRLNLTAPFDALPGLYRARIGSSTVTVDPIVPAAVGVAGNPNEGPNYTANKATIATLPTSPNLDTLLSNQLRTRAQALATDIGDFEINVPTTAEIETAIGDMFHTELASRNFIALWTPSATNAAFTVDNLAVEVIAEALIIALNGDGGSDVTAITGFIPAGREFAIALDGATVQDQIDSAIVENGYDQLPKRFEQDDETVDLNSLSVFLVAGAIRMEGNVTVIDAILGSIDVDADFRVDVGLHWVPNGTLSAQNVQKLEHHIIGDPDVDPEESVLFWVIAIILAVISFGAGSVLIGIIIIVVALVVQAIASNIGSEMLVDGVTGAIEGIQAWPSELSRIGRVNAVFHDNPGPDPDGVLIDTTGLVLEGTMDIVSSCEATMVMAAASGGPYTTKAAAPLLLKAANIYSAAAYRWLPGDGAIETATKDRLHTYTASGLFVAKHGLRVQEPGGAASRHFALVHVENVPPVVDVGPDITVDEGEVVTLVGTFYDVEPADTHESIWIFGDDQAPKAGVIVETHVPPRAEGTSTVEHAWCDNGEYIVLLRVRDQNGGVGTDTLRVTVLNVPPRVEAGPDLYAYPCTAITLTAHFEDPGWCDTHEGHWNFGDCTPDHTAIIDEVNEPPAARGIVVASHVYEHCGTYHAVCTVIDDDGGVGSDYTVIRVVQVNNAGFEDGFRRLAAGEVANHWAPYYASGAALSAVPAAVRVFSCERCAVHSGRRSQAIELNAAGRAGIWQSVGANPQWAYQITVWCHLSEGSSGRARLGVDPAGGSDPDAPGISWTEVTFSQDWAQLVRRVVAVGSAITIFLEADGDAAVAAGAAGGAKGSVFFDDVALVPVQPFCPEEAPDEVAKERCVDFRDLEPDRQLPPVYDKEGFIFRAMDQAPLRTVAYGPPPGETKLAIGRRGVMVELPFVAEHVKVTVGVNGRTPVYVSAASSGGVVVGSAASQPGSNAAQTLELSAPDILRLQISSKSGEDTLVEICAREAKGGSRREPPPLGKSAAGLHRQVRRPG